MDKYIVSKSQLEDFLQKSLDVKDDNQKHIYLNLMELAKELMSNPINNDIIASCVHSTKKWLYHYILDILDRDDKNYKDIKRVIEEVCTFQEDILKEISK